ncbi:YrrS family protein [Radiobacillus deserti]|uniref:DUF1510 family protein n=1 Tax=Radiobacillus deserti TaxID=2594883 RepID=A0A516KH29_9BACI|nr:YrrS family protein [Radiobacillus deserti]QDP40687.1 DUF1510 family protein [Radiobacillus deserti]
MSDEYNPYTRVDKFEKRRKNTKAISFLIGIGSILLVVLIGLIIFGGGEEETAQDTKEEPETESVSSDMEDSTLDSSESTTDTDSDKTTDVETSDEEEVDPVVEEVPSDDPNVIKAFQGDWEPIGTQQEGNHVITFEQGTVDWKEMMDAVSMATGLSRTDMIQWWVSRSGDQSVQATVSNPSETEIYRVSVKWVDHQGWQPTLVEQLKENDQKHRFKEDSSNDSGAQTE